MISRPLHKVLPCMLSLTSDTQKKQRAAVNGSIHSRRVKRTGRLVSWVSVAQSGRSFLVLFKSGYSGDSGFSVSDT